MSGPFHSPRYLPIVSLVLALVALGVAVAAIIYTPHKTASSPPEQVIATGASKTPEPTRIETNREAGTFTFIVDGKPVAKLSKDDLFILGNITYGGVLTDAGEDHVRKAITGQPQPRGR